MITPYSFMVTTNHGISFLNFPETEWTEPVPVKITGPDDVIEDYFKRHGYNMDGMQVMPDFVSPLDAYHILLMNETYKSPLIMGFKLMYGEVPKVYQEDEDGQVLESAEKAKKGVHFKQKRFTLQDRYEFQGFPISIENKRGRTRSGKDPDNHPWSIKMKFDYGYIRRTNGLDNEGIDVYVGKDRKAKYVYVVKQHKIEEVKKWSTDYCPDCKEHVWDCACPQFFDEDKVFIGFPNREAVQKAYLKQYDNIRFMGPIARYPVDKFKKLLWGRSKKKRVRQGLNIPLALESSEDIDNRVGSTLGFDDLVKLFQDEGLIQEADKELFKNLRKGTVVGGRDAIKELFKGAGKNKKSTNAIRFQVVGEKEARDIQEATGLDLKGFKHTVKWTDVRHIIKHHGNAEQESLRGQLAVTEDDVSLIPDIIKNYDSIELLDRTDNDNNQLIQYSKVYDGKIVYTVSVIAKHWELAAKSLRKHKVK